MPLMFVAYTFQTFYKTEHSLISELYILHEKRFTRDQARRELLFRPAPVLINKSRQPRKRMNASGIRNRILPLVKSIPNRLSTGLTVSCVNHRYVNVTIPEDFPNFKSMCFYHQKCINCIISQPDCESEKQMVANGSSFVWMLYLLHRLLLKGSFMCPFIVVHTRTGI